MIDRGPFTYSTGKVANGWSVIRTDATGYELVWEIVGSEEFAKERCRFWQDYSSPPSTKVAGQ